jgi:hypothetical protein
MNVIRRLCAFGGNYVLDRRLAVYVAATSAVGTAFAPDAAAIIIGNSAVRPFGINGEVPIDFNNDGQIDYEIDHDRVNLGNGNVVDYLQIDKNDFNGASIGESLLPIDRFDRFPLNGTVPNETLIPAGAGFPPAGYLTPTVEDGEYPAALAAGTLIGPDSYSFFEFEEWDRPEGRIRANRLIDEDHGQVDMLIDGLDRSEVAIPRNGPNFLGLGGETHYVGVRTHLNGDGLVRYGWIGVRITNEADATGEVVGWAYETTGLPIRAGQIPEPGTSFTLLIGAAMIAGLFLWRQLLGRRQRARIS